MPVFLNLNLIICLTAAAVNLGLGIFIFLKNRSSEINLSFGLLLFFTALWTLFSFFLLHMENEAGILIFRRISTSCSALLVACFLYFSCVFPSREGICKCMNKWAIFLPAVIIALPAIFSGWLIADVEIIKTASAVVVKPAYGFLYPVATFYYLLYVGLALANLIAKHVKATGREKLQIFYVLLGIGFTGIFAILTALILPLLGIPQYFAWGLPITLIMAGMIAYSIAAHHLLDVEDFFTRGLFVIAIALSIVGSLVIVQAGRINFLLSYYLSLFIFALSVMVLFKGIKNPINISFSAVLFIAALWTFSIGMFLEAKSVQGLFFWSRIYYVLGALIPGVMLYFSSVFPSPWLRIKEWQKSILFLPTLMIAPLSLIPHYMIREFYFEQGGIFARLGPFYNYYIFYYAMYFGLAFVNLYYKYSLVNPIDKSRIRYVLWGLSIVGVFATIFNIILPWFGDFRYVWVGTYSTVFLAAMVSYAIIKHRLMDISVVISRTLAEGLTLFLLGLIYWAMIWLYKQNVSREIDLLSVVLSLAYGAFAIYAYQNIRYFIQTSADKIFLRGKYDYYKVLADASTRVVEALSLHSILSILYDTFCNVVGISRPRIYLPENFTDPEKSSNCYIVYKDGNIPENLYEEKIYFNDPLIDKLLTTRQPGIDLDNPNRELVIPCLLEKRLIAFFVLGSKISEDAYSDEDIRLLTVLANQAAISLDHTRSYEKVRSELGFAEKELTRSQRLASIGTLTAGVTHEIRNPLTVIRMETERLANQPRDLDYLRDFRSLILKHIDRVEGIVQRMLNLARRRKAEYQQVKLDEVVESILPFFNFTQLTLETNLQDTAPVKGSTEELQQVFINLIQNAIDATPPGGKVGISTFMLGDKAIAEVSDTGSGIPEGAKDRIFDPFYSTKSKGVGLGLSIVYKIIKEHKAELKVESAAGKGTTFRIIFGIN